MEFERIDVVKHREYIVPFRKDSFLISFGTDQDFGSDEEYINWVKQNIRKYPDGFVLLVEEGNPIGQLELTIKKYEGDAIGYINLYYLIPEKRGYGLGKRHHQYALTFFENHGVKEYHLRVSPTNHYARSFYQKIGMIEIGQEVNGKVIRMKGFVNKI